MKTYYSIVLVVIMVLIAIIQSTTASQVATTYDHSNLEKLWSDFKTNFKKTFKNSAEEIHRFFIFWSFYINILFLILEFKLKKGNFQ
jgi:hypothetical protein